MWGCKKLVASCPVNRAADGRKIHTLDSSSRRRVFQSAMTMADITKSLGFVNGSLARFLSRDDLQQAHRWPSRLTLAGLPQAYSPLRNADFCGEFRLSQPHVVAQFLDLDFAHVPFLGCHYLTPATIAK
jgi:hypothetical protein